MGIAAAQATPSSGKNDDAAAESSHALRILLVEDDVDTGFLLEQALSAEPYFEFSLTHVQTLGEVPTALSSESFDVVLLDLGLPESQGLDTLLLAREVITDIPIIVLTGMNDDELGIMAVQAGADDYLVKGCEETRQIVRALRYGRERHRHVRALRALNAKLKQALDQQIAAFRRVREQAVRSDRMAALGTIAAGVAHELNSPLMGIINHLQHAMAGLPRDSDETHEVLTRALEYSRRCAGVIEALLAHVREQPEGGARSNTPGGDVRGAIDRALRSSTELIESGRIDVDLEIAEELRDVALDCECVEIVMLNLIRNACQAMEDTSSPCLRMRAVGLQDSVEIVVSDNGSGLDERMIDHLFDPLYSTKSAAVGIGLGLALCKRLVESTGGNISASANNDRGMRFVVALPLIEVAGGPQRSSVRT